MKPTGLKLLVGIFLLLTIFAVPALSVEKPGAAGGAAMSAPGQRVDLSEPSRVSAEVANFLSQPALSAALSKAKSDKMAAEEASQNPNAYLAKNGVRVPANTKIQIQPGGGGESRLSIEITIRCCPPSVTIIIRL
jgi:hypothetical protein